MSEYGRYAVCRYCGSEFVTKPNSRVYCSSACSVRAEREGNECFYCGELGDTKDHVAPVSFDANSKETVVACRECNTFLSNKHGFHMYERIMHLHDKLIKKYRLHKPFIEWSEDELDELGPGLRKGIAAAQTERYVAERRVSHVKIRALQFKNERVAPVDEEHEDDAVFIQGL